jgi:DNA-binding NtrC family response regulator
VAVTLLIVEDDARLRDILALAFSNEGYAVLTAKNGAEALTRCDSYPISLVVSDVRMPVLDGYGLLDGLRSRGNHLPVILMSATGDPACVPPCVDALTKPFDIDELFALVASALDPLAP